MQFASVIHQSPFTTARATRDTRTIYYKFIFTKKNFHLDETFPENPRLYPRNNVKFDVYGQFIEKQLWGGV